MNRKYYIDKIIELLTELKRLVETSNGTGLYDINKYSEDFFKHFLNLIFNLKLENINFSEKENYPAIDLGDKISKISIQVTSESKSAKLKKTIKSFNKHGLYKIYTRLVMLIIIKKGKYTTTFDTEGKFVFNENKDIMDCEDLIKFIQSEEVDKIKLVYEFLEKELGKRPDKKIIASKANEVETIMEMIHYLSENKQYTDLKDSLEPDPERKIYKRFADHSIFLTGIYTELAPIYKKIKDDAVTVYGLDLARITVIRTYLMTKSNDVLTECEGDPKKALKVLIDFFGNEISLKGIRYDESAISYYLIDELINCTVFPN